MGFVLLGLATANVLGVSGCCAANVFPRRDWRAPLRHCRNVYRRAHTRDLDGLASMGLRPRPPVRCVRLCHCVRRLDGHPGFSGFAAEITILIGAWKSYPIAVWITGIGMVLVAAFTLRALKRSFFEENVVVNTGGRPPCRRSHYRQSPRGKIGRLLLMFTTLAVGLYPKLVLDRIVPAVEAMRFLK